MKKIYRVIQEVKIGDKAWGETTCFGEYHYCEAIDEGHTYFTFNSLVTAVKGGSITNAEIGYSLFKKRPQVYISSTLSDFTTKITEKNFSYVQTRMQYLDYSDYNIASIAKLIPATEFFEYLKDNGIQPTVNI